MMGRQVTGYSILRSRAACASTMREVGPAASLHSCITGLDCTRAPLEQLPLACIQTSVPTDNCLLNKIQTTPVERTYVSLFIEELASSATVPAKAIFTPLKRLKLQAPLLDNGCFLGRAILFSSIRLILMVKTY